jgi:hypothetical protein
MVLFDAKSDKSSATSIIPENEYSSIAKKRLLPLLQRSAGIISIPMLLITVASIIAISPPAKPILYKLNPLCTLMDALDRIGKINPTKNPNKTPVIISITRLNIPKKAISLIAGLSVATSIAAM